MEERRLCEREDAHLPWGIFSLRCSWQGLQVALELGREGRLWKSPAQRWSLNQEHQLSWTEPWVTPGVEKEDPEDGEVDKPERWGN